jgi:putative FmdB family regulatory protein
VPTYEYACKKCGEHLDVQQSFSDPALTTCPSCKGPLRKVFGNIAITFKGSGFYKTDSRSSNGKGAKKDGEGSSDAAAAAAKSGDTSGDKSGESKSGEKSDSAAAKSGEAKANKSGESKSGESKSTSGDAKAKSDKPGSNAPTAAAS